MISFLKTFGEVIVSSNLKALEKSPKLRLSQSLLEATLSQNFSNALLYANISFIAPSSEEL